MSRLDWTIIALYLLAVVGLGVVAGFVRRSGERGGEGGHYFLAGNTLTWPVIGLAMFAANISTVHLVSLAEAAYKYGLVFGNFEWMAGFHVDFAFSVFRAALSAIAGGHAAGFSRAPFQSRLPGRAVRHVAVFGHRHSHGGGALHGGVGVARHSWSRARTPRSWGWMR